MNPDVFYVDNRPVLEAGHSTPSVVQFKEGRSYSFTRHFYGVHSGQFQLQNFDFFRCVKTIVFHVITHLSVTEFGVEKICPFPTFLSAYIHKCIVGNLPVSSRALNLFLDITSASNAKGKEKHTSPVTT